MATQSWSTDVLPVVAPADDVEGVPQGKWTYESYAAIPDDGQFYEVIDGILYTVPTRGSVHQHVSTWFTYYLGTNVMIPGLGRVYHARYDVRLRHGTVVQPDIVVVLKANLDRMVEEGLNGPPDLVVEITIPATATHDRSTKLRAYEASGVPEYWIADPFARTIEVMVLQEGTYRSRGIFQSNALLPSTIVPGLPVRVAQFFA